MQRKPGLLAAHGGTRAVIASARCDGTLALPGSPRRWSQSPTVGLQVASAHPTLLETKLSPPPHASPLVQRGGSCWTRSLRWTRQW